MLTFTKVTAADFLNVTIISPSLIKKILPKRDAHIHKGDCGRLFVLAGSKGLTGAAIMASKSALRCGAGLITLGCPESLNNIFECSLTEVMTLPLDDDSGVLNCNDINIITARAAASDCTLSGPGLTCSDCTKQITEQLVQSCTKPLVLDADSINALSKNINILNNRKCDIILTPHIGEFSRLTGLDSKQILASPAVYAKEFATKHRLTLVLKSHRTVVATPDGRVYTNILGNPGMATGGTGDVLAGSIAAFAAQGMSCENAALSGVYIHSLAADMAAEEFGEYGLTPEDIINTLPYAIKFSLKSGM
jgi:NAD(P)H-hydrate epimerase